MFQAPCLAAAGPAHGVPGHGKLYGFVATCDAIRTTSWCSWFAVDAIGMDGDHGPGSARLGKIMSVGISRATSRIRVLRGDELGARPHPEPDPDLNLAEQEPECR